MFSEAFVVIFSVVVIASSLAWSVYVVARDVRRAKARARAAVAAAQAEALVARQAARARVAAARARRGVVD